MTIRPAVLTTALLALSCQHGLAQDPPPPEGPVFVAARQRVAPETVLEGVLEPAETVAIRYDPRAFREGVRIREAAAPMTRVEAGAPLLSLERDAFDAARAEASREADEARTALARAEASLVQHDVESAQSLDRLATAARQAAERLAAYESWEAEARHRDLANDVQGNADSVADQEVEIQQLEAMYAASELAHETRDLVLDRARRRLARSRVSLDVSRAALRSHEEREHPHRLETLRQEEQKTETEFAHARALAPLRRNEFLLTVEEARQTLARKERRATEIEADAAQFEARAPFAGIVVPGDAIDRIDGTLGDLRDQRDVLEPGRSVQPGQTVLTLVREGALRARARIGAPRSGEAVLGGTVTVRLPGFPDVHCAGTIASVSPIAVIEDPRTGSRACAVRIDLAPGGLSAPEARPGCSVEIVIAGEAWEALAIPRAGLQVAGDAASCWVLVEGRAERRTLRTGRDGGTWVEVLEGLSEGETVLLSR